MIEGAGSVHTWIYTKEDLWSRCMDQYGCLWIRWRADVWRRRTPTSHCSAPQDKIATGCRLGTNNVQVGDYVHIWLYILLLEMQQGAASCCRLTGGNCTVHTQFYTPSTAHTRWYSLHCTHRMVLPPLYAEDGTHIIVHMSVCKKIVNTSLEAHHQPLSISDTLGWAHSDVRVTPHHSITHVGAITDCQVHPYNVHPGLTACQDAFNELKLFEQTLSTPGLHWNDVRTYVVI